MHEEPIEFLLEQAGEDLVFAAATLKGIPGNSVYHVQDFSSVYDMDKQDFDFKVSTEAFRKAGLKRNSVFTYTAFGKSYTFKVIKSPEDLTGWTTLAVTLEGISSV